MRFAMCRALLTVGVFVMGGCGTTSESGGTDSAQTSTGGASALGGASGAGGSAGEATAGSAGASGGSGDAGASGGSGNAGAGSGGAGASGGSGASGGAGASGASGAAGASGSSGGAGASGASGGAGASGASGNAGSAGSSGAGVFVGPTTIASTFTSLVGVTSDGFIVTLAGADVVGTPFDTPISETIHSCAHASACQVVTTSTAVFVLDGKSLGVWTKASGYVALTATSMLWASQPSSSVAFEPVSGTVAFIELLSNDPTGAKGRVVMRTLDGATMTDLGTFSSSAIIRLVQDRFVVELSGAAGRAVVATPSKVLADLPGFDVQDLDFASRAKHAPFAILRSAGGSGAYAFVSLADGKVTNIPPSVGFCAAFSTGRGAVMSCDSATQSVLTEYTPDGGKTELATLELATFYVYNSSFEDRFVVYGKDALFSFDPSRAMTKLAQWALPLWMVSDFTADGSRFIFLGADDAHPQTPFIISIPTTGEAATTLTGIAETATVAKGRYVVVQSHLADDEAKVGDIEVVDAVGLTVQTIETANASTLVWDAERRYFAYTTTGPSGTEPSSVRALHMP